MPPRYRVSCMLEESPRSTEEYQFWRLYSVDMADAAQTASLLDTESHQAVRYTLLRDLVTAYARPFSGNRGKVLRRHRLTSEWAPEHQRSLHAELVALRDQAIAHTDHEFRNPSVSRWPYAGGAAYFMSLKVPRYDELLARLPEIRQLIAAVTSGLDARIRTFEQFHEIRCAMTKSRASRTDGAGDN